ncbi:hypothetical protein EJB05_26248 [Eragrostis curvula]|uniref:DUF6598 domain-containing protein n=1 Tax=Eragrostis curvula TaxID=38414 RepID=A0A5J9UK75_9POAL|nr:hypothetical protein EJB05_26248 [Eragrostis curvula]
MLVKAPKWNREGVSSCSSVTTHLGLHLHRAMAQKPVVVDVDFVIAADKYDANIKKLRAILADHPKPEDVDGHPVLAKQLPKEPARWIHINASTGDHKATILAVRDDNVYLIGFKAKSGTWFEFGYKKSSARIIPGSTFLECGPDYRSLLGDKYKVEVLKLELGKSFAEKAVVKLSGYVQPTQPPGAPDEETKRGLARLIVMICESSRMIPIFDTVSKGWASGTSLGDKLKLSYLHNWGNMSEALLGWKKYGNKYKPTDRVAAGLKEAKITNKNDALAVVALLLNRPPPSQKVAHNIEEEDERRSAWHLHAAANLKGQGRQLVEVFAVRAAFPFTGTVAVFDGIHGQIIYKQEHHHLQPTLEGEMVLTGPYRAISVDGSFAIKVDMDSASAGNDAGGELTWNCYDHAANTVYDVPLKGAIGTNHGPVEVTYAVLTNGVEATVQVRLLLAQAAAGTLIHGKVTARSKAFDVASVLFSHGSEHKVAVAANEAKIPLNRSVISVPLDAPLEVEASFGYTPADADHGREGTVQANFEFYPELYGDHVKREFTEHGEIEVKVTWSDI